MDAGFLKVHFLALKFSLPEAFSHEELSAIALEALQIMDHYQALHPMYTSFQEYVRDRPEAAQFTSDWARKIEGNHPNTSFLVEVDEAASTDKQKVVDEFKQILAVLVIQCDFRMVQFYLGKLENIVQFPGQVTSLQGFTENRFFEHLFYQTVALIFGHWWFELAKKVKHESDEPYSGPSGPRNIASIEKRTHTYHTRCSFLFKSLEDKPEAVVNSIQPELQYYNLVQWLCVLAKFTQGKFHLFIAEFDRLYGHILALECLDLESETLLMYAVASIATRPFKDLNFNLNEALVDAYTEKAGSLELRVFDVLTLLSNGEFHAAKVSLSDEELLKRLHACLGFALPEEKESFFERLCRLIDQKAFLLILSLTKRILREKLLAMLGYAPGSAIYDDVSNKLLLLVSVLSAGESNIVYESATDLFCYKLSPDADKIDLQTSVEELTHEVRAEASASMLKSLLMKKHFES